MDKVAKIFINGHSQAVRLPAAYRFDVKEVFIHQDPLTGDIILSRKPSNWDTFLATIDKLNIDANFLTNSEHQQCEQERDPFAGCIV